MTDQENGQTTELPTLKQLRKDLIEASETLGPREIRYLVDVYYQLQEYRKRASNQGRASAEAEPKPEPIGAVILLLDQFRGMENAIKSALDKWTDEHPMGEWAKAHVGVGPVIAAGLIAHIDPERAKTAGAVWRFAGLDPTLEWKKGQKRPYNARLKVLSWKLADSFKKQKGREGCFYGHEYERQKLVYVERNERGDYEERAKETLTTRNLGDNVTRKAYERGRLPDGRVDQMAMRWAAKLFLSHFLEEWRRQLGLPIVAPYPIAHLGHAHKIEAPTS